MKEGKASQIKEKTHRQYPAAMVNITNECTLRCKHCFIYREGNPNDPKGEMNTSLMVRKLSELQRRHNIQNMLWMGGEPLLRPDVLHEGTKFFQRNTITTKTINPFNHKGNPIINSNIAIVID